jgi:hypothetical protein
MAAFRAYVLRHGGDPSQVEELPGYALGDFLCFRDADGATGFASIHGVISFDGTGDWRGFLRSGDAALVASRVAMAQNQGMTLVLDPTGSQPAHVSDAEWQQVTAPALTEGADGTLTLTAWMGDPPGFGPVRLTVVAPPAGTAAVSRETADALLEDDARTDAQLSALEGPSNVGQRSVAEALGNAREPRAVPGLLRMLSSGWVEARKTAAKSLGQIGDRSATQPLSTALLRETDAFAYHEMIRALVALGGDDARAALSEAAARHPDAGARAAAGAAAATFP